LQLFWIRQVLIQSNLTGGFVLTGILISSIKSLLNWLEDADAEDDKILEALEELMERRRRSLGPQNPYPSGQWLGIFKVKRLRVQRTYKRLMMDDYCGLLVRITLIQRVALTGHMTKWARQELIIRESREGFVESCFRLNKGRTEKIASGVGETCEL
jgi:hypothetical protein